jgi:integrase
MAINVQPRRGKFQLRVTHKLIPNKNHKAFFTFDSEEKAYAEGKKWDYWLDQGVVHDSLKTKTPKVNSTEDPPLARVILDYIEHGTQVAPTDVQGLKWLAGWVGDVRVSGITVKWSDDFVHRLKLERKLTPSTVRKRVQSLARALDWHLRKSTPDGQIPPANTLRMLQKGYSGYSKQEAQILRAQGDEPGVDKPRMRRLPHEEEELIQAALSGQLVGDAIEPFFTEEEVASQFDLEFATLFNLIINTGLRLREGYTLRTDQFDFRQGFINVEGTKGHYGEIKPRTVPMTDEVKAMMRRYCKGRVGRIFSFWDGDKDTLAKISSKLSTRFSDLFRYCEIEDCTEHDLRHESTCRWFLMRRQGGHWMYSETEICIIMGWSDRSMLKRYASLRGKDLSERLSEAMEYPAKTAAHA